MLFSQVAGQRSAKEGLLKMWHSGHLPHALLIAGAEGTGGLPLALAIAQYIFCTNKSGTDACGVCAGCSKVQRLEHADLHLSFPTIAPKAHSRNYTKEFKEFITQTPYGTTYEWLQYIDAENKQGNISAEECRDIIEMMYLKSYEGGKKIQIIWRAEYLGKEGNILLKLIEEPPADALLLLVVENAEAVLPTIRSRTQLIKLPPVAAKDIADALLKRSITDERKALQVAHLAGGNYREALRLVQHSGNDLFADVRNWFNAMFTNNGFALSRFAEEWSKAGREQQKNFLQYVIQLLEQSLRTMYLPQVPPALPHEETEFVKRLATRNIAYDNLQQMVQCISDTIYFIERNAHSKTQLHALCIRLVHIIQDRVVKEFMY